MDDVMGLRIVELKSAYHWHCEDCAADNFAVPMRAELTNEWREKVYRKFKDLNPWDELPEGWEQFDLFHLPNKVTCKDCGATFGTIDEQLAEGY